MMFVGNNLCVVKDQKKIFHADVGDFMFIKGTMFPYGSKGLVHKAPEKVYHSDGRIVNRLVLKIDVERITTDPSEMPTVLSNNLDKQYQGPTIPLTDDGDAVEGEPIDTSEDEDGAASDNMDARTKSCSSMDVDP